MGEHFSTPALSLNTLYVHTTVLILKKIIAWHIEMPSNNRHYGSIGV